MQIILPKRTSLKQAERFLEEQRDWVERHLESLVFPDFSLKENWPDSLLLPTLGCYFLHYHEQALAKTFRCVMQEKDLHFFGQALSFEKCLKKIKIWLKKLAITQLGQRLRELSLQTGLSYKTVGYKDPLTRWGSCSSEGVIYLSIKLLFLPQDLIDYVLIHELCHTQHFNHSAEFWCLVERYMPDYLEKKRELKEISQAIPSWYYL